MNFKSEELKNKKQVAFFQYSNGNYQEAREVCEEVCQLDPSDQEILCMLGIIYGKWKQLHKSVRYLRKSIEVNPEYVDAHYNLALILRELGNMKDACQELEFAIARNPLYIRAHLALGSIRMASGYYQQAVDCYRTVRSLDPHNIVAVAGEAEVYEKQGKNDQAYKIIKPYITGTLANAQIAHIYGTLARKMGNCHEAIDRLEKILDNKEMIPDARVNLHFILGDLYDEIGKYDEAFRHYNEGNKLKGVYFNSYAFRIGVKQLIRSFSSINLDRMPRSRCRSNLPLFIVGMPRSGTSLVEQILASHSDVHGAGELGDIGRLVNELTNGSEPDYNRPDCVLLMSARLDEAANQYLDNLRSLKPAALRTTDKMPTNFLHLGYIQMMFPNARIIHCKRNALDTCLSCYFQNFSSGMAYAFNLNDIGRYYLGYRKLMEHWKRVLQIPIREIEYEELISNPEKEIRNLIAFCGLAWDANCLRHEENSRIIRTASYDQASKPIYSKSIGRWRKYEKHIGPLISVLGNQL